MSSRHAGPEVTEGVYEALNRPQTITEKARAFCSSGYKTSNHFARFFAFSDMSSDRSTGCISACYGIWCRSRGAQNFGVEGLLRHRGVSGCCCSPNRIRKRRVRFLLDGRPRLICHPSCLHQRLSARFSNSPIAELLPRQMQTILDMCGRPQGAEWEGRTGGATCEYGEGCATRHGDDVACRKRIKEGSEMLLLRRTETVQIPILHNKSGTSSRWDVKTCAS